MLGQLALDILGSASNTIRSQRGLSTHSPVEDLALRWPSSRRGALSRRLEIGQPSGDRCAISIEACKSLADLRLLCCDLVQYWRRCGLHGGLQWFQGDRNDQSCWRLTPQREIFNWRMRRQASLATDPVRGAAQDIERKLTEHSARLILFYLQKRQLLATSSQRADDDGE